MPFNRRPLFMVLIMCAATAWSQPNTNEPYIGYLYPAGGQQGSEIQITAGGQFLRGSADVYISGKGVHASIIKHIRPFRNLDQTQRQELQQRIKEVWDKRLAELNIESRDSIFPKGNLEKKTDEKLKPLKKENDPNKPKVELPDHPLLYDLDNKSIRELINIRELLFNSRRKQQPNRQFAESVLIKITIDPDAEPGNRELRIGTPAGLTNPVVFQVGLLPEIRELEPNNRKAYPEIPNLPNLPKEKPIELPVSLNGQIMPGDVDRFRFRAQEGQKLVIDAQARSLIPYLADAVPGWFQAQLTLYDSNNNEVSFNDDYRFNPDPVIFYQIPANGEYELEIRDSLYRGREDFVYHIAVGELPFITQMSPLGGREGVKTFASIDGPNLANTRLLLDAEPCDGGIRQAVCHKGKLISNPIPYAIDTLPECDDIELNNTIKNAQPVNLPIIINGNIARPGDVDIFQFKGKAGDKIAAQVCARRLNSPVDSLLRLTDESGKILKWNDDYVTEDNHLYKDTTGLITHLADSYLLAQLPGDGNYYVHITDSQNHGGRAYGYRLRISAPQPDFALRMTPSSLNVRAGAVVPFCVYALRKDGFDGKIEVSLKDAPVGFELAGGLIPAGRDYVRMTLTAPLTASNQPVSLQIEGRAKIGEKIISHQAVPSEDKMQAFLYRHLVPSQELMAAVIKSRQPALSVKLPADLPVKIPSGGTTQITCKTWKRPMPKKIELKLSEPPEGLTLQDVKVVPEGLAFQLKADKNMKSGFTDNLIVEAYTELTPRQKTANSANQNQRVLMGLLPAIPIEIVQQLNGVD